MNDKFKSVVYENYNDNTVKFLGIISYKNLIIVMVYLFSIFKILEYIDISIVYKSYIIIFLFIPILAGSIINIHGDNILDTIKILLKFYLNRKIYINDYKNVSKFLKNNKNKEAKIL